MGYNCAICGAWVADGMIHNCSGFRSYPIPTTAIGPAPTTIQPWFDNAALNRIAAALERIVEVMDKAEAERG